MKNKIIMLLIIAVFLTSLSGCIETIPPEIPTFIILRPTGDRITDWTPFGETEHWKCVDEESSDGIDTYVTTGTEGGMHDQYFVSDAPSDIRDRDIESITVSAMLSGHVLCIGWYDCGNMHGAIAYVGPDERYPDFGIYTQTWSTNRDETWIWDDIDNLALYLRSQNSDTDVYCTQIWLHVDLVDI